MNLIIDIPDDKIAIEYGKVVSIGRNNDKELADYIFAGTPLPKDATNGDVLKMLFPPSVYYGDDEKHIVLLTKDCELTCYNNEWWNAPYKVESEE